ncbi:arsenate reductase/protein-tyrosine-phosphatase family protein [Streptosporangium pseudovulgare]|uniref:ArsR family transcriptional regulator n=1 Tax=Streptosporangium pseudovulgare TaxID=35765 RepID=A0ABQ2QFC0_9ACTN|nr:ArsR family transcriptional regulator [Streptosporangium pseudovulgare]GGP79526.1 ArsR family transcriptional regulator [Streptosporangium pseudovulgare]
MVPSGQPVPPPFVRLAAHQVRWRLLSELARSDLRVRELVTLVGQPQNLVSYHLRLLRSAGLVNARRSSFDGRDSYYHLDLERCAHALAAAGDALHPALRLLSAETVTAAGTSAAEAPARPSVLFTCTGNSARSPIAEALLRHHAGDRAEVTSAGSHPKACLHPDAVRVLRRRYGIDIADRRPRHLSTLAGHRFDYVISLCDKVREVCPDFNGHPRRLHWSVPDPADGGDTAEDGYAAFDRTAAEIDTRIRYLHPVLFPTPHREVQP